MKEKLEQLLAEGKQRIASVATETELQDIKAALLGKQGSLTELMKELPKLDVSLRPEMGKAVNQVKGQLSALLDERRDELKMKASEVDPDFDISVPGTMPLSGGLHPITQMCYDLNDAFRSMGFEIFQEDAPVLTELASREKVIGVKQSARAIRDGRAQRVFLACDADELVLEPIRSACGSLPVEEGYTMAQLGRACGIAVGAAVVTVLN